jgi:hypothetical protein
MSHEIRVKANCPNCNSSLMEPGVQVDALDSILFLAKVGNSRGNLYLSQIYGSYNKIFKQVEDITGSIVECSCPRCSTPFPVVGTCECKAPIIALDLKDGGNIKVCTRNGCKKHSLEFENSDDAFSLFQSQDKAGLF